MNKRTKLVIEHMFSDHKKQRKKEKDFIKITKPYLLRKIFYSYISVFYSISQTGRQNIHRIDAYI